MYSKPAVGPETAKPDEVWAEFSTLVTPKPGEIRTRWLPMYSAPAVGHDSKKTDEVVVRDLRRSTAELQRDTLGIALVGFEPTASGLQCMYSEPAVGLVSLAGRRGFVQTHCSTVELHPPSD
jgi:hypothetical protein